MFIILIIVVGTLMLIENEKEFNENNITPPKTNDSLNIKPDTLNQK